MKAHRLADCVAPPFFHRFAQNGDENGEEEAEDDKKSEVSGLTENPHFGASEMVQRVRALSSLQSPRPAQADVARPRSDQARPNPWLGPNFRTSCRLLSTSNSGRRGSQPEGWRVTAPPIIRRWPRSSSQVRPHPLLPSAHRRCVQTAELVQISLRRALEV